MHPRETKISPWQLAMILIPGIGSTALPSFPSATAVFARQDAWLAPLVALPFSAFVIWVCGRLASRFPEETFAEYAPKVLGTVPGKLCGLLLFWYFFHVDAAIAREFADFLIATAHPRTPMPLAVGLAMFATAIAVRHGPEILARLGELVIFPSVFLVLLIIGLAYDNIDPYLLQPVLENGWRPVLMSAWLSHYFTGHLVLLVVLFPAVRGLQAGIKASYGALATIVAALVLVSAVSISVLGPLTSSYYWPFFKVSRVGSFGAVLARLDPLVTGFWVAGSCFKLAVTLYAAVITFAHIFGLRDWRPLVLPLAALMAAYAVGHMDNLVEHQHMLIFFWPPYTQVFQLVLPALVLLVAAVRGVEGKPGGAR